MNADRGAPSRRTTVTDEAGCAKGVCTGTSPTSAPSSPTSCWTGPRSSRRRRVHCASPPHRPGGRQPHQSADHFGIAILAHATTAISACLADERELGRIAADADIDSLTLPLVGAGISSSPPPPGGLNLDSRHQARARSPMCGDARVAAPPADRPHRSGRKRKPHRHRSGRSRTLRTPGLLRAAHVPPLTPARHQHCRAPAGSGHVSAPVRVDQSSHLHARQPGQVPVRRRTVVVPARSTAALTPAKSAPWSDSPPERASHTSSARGCTAVR